MVKQELRDLLDHLEYKVILDPLETLANLEMMVLMELMVILVML